MTTLVFQMIAIIYSTISRRLPPPTSQRRVPTYSYRPNTNTTTEQTRTLPSQPSQQHVSHAAYHAILCYSFCVSTASIIHAVKSLQASQWNVFVHHSLHLLARPGLSHWEAMGCDAMAVVPTPITLVGHWLGPLLHSPVSSRLLVVCTFASVFRLTFEMQPDS